MERLTIRSSDAAHENGVCCTHFNSKECHEVGGDCAYGCKREEDAWSKLCDYEDAEEQGLLLRLPESDWNDLIKQLATIIANDFIVYMDEREFIVNQIFFLEYDEEFRFSATCRNFYGDDDCWECESDKECKYSEEGNGCYITFCFSDFGKIVFLTKSEAEKALAELQSK